MLAIGVEQVGGTVSPLLIARTAEGLFETLGRNLDKTHAFLKSRQFGHRLCLDRFKARTKPAGGAFQERDDETRVLATTLENEGEALQQLGQILSGSHLKPNRSDGGYYELVASALGLGNNDCGLGSAYSENHAPIFADDKARVKTAIVARETRDGASFAEPD